MIPASWTALLEALIEAVWVVHPVDLHIAAVNRAALDLVGMPREDMVGTPAIAWTGTPEDLFFWEDVAAGLMDKIHSDTWLRAADGVSIPVERRVERVWIDPTTPVFLVGLRDLRQQRRTESELETLLAELRATLESTADGILANDLEGRVRNYNRRFAELWDVPEDLMLQRDDAALFAHQAAMVVDGTGYQDRLSHLARSPLLEACDQLVLHSGRTLERVSMPQFSRGQPSGRVFAFRDISQRIDAEARLRVQPGRDIHHRAGLATAGRQPGLRTADRPYPGAAAGFIGARHVLRRA